MVKSLSCSSLDSGVANPVVISLLLFSRSVVSVCLNIHFLNLIFLFKTTTCCIEKFFGMKTISGHLSKSYCSIFCCARPLITAFVTRSERFSDGRSILTFVNIVSHIVETSNVLSLYYVIDSFCFQNFTAIWMIVGDILHISLHSWVYLLQSYLLSGGFTIFFSVIWCSNVAFVLIREKFTANTHICVVPTCCDHFSSLTNVWDGIWSNFQGRRLYC